MDASTPAVAARGAPAARGLAPIRSCLVVDEETVFVEAISPCLRDAGVRQIDRLRRAEDAVLASRRVRPDLVFVYVDPRDEDGLRFPAALGAAHRPLVVAVTERGDGRTQDVIRRHGFDAHLTKDLPLEAFCDRIHAIVARRPMAPVRDRSEEGRSPLTNRETTVLHALVEGTSDHAIARSLGISPHTVRSHVRNVLRKLGVRTRAEAAAVAVRGGLV